MSRGLCRAARVAVVVAACVVIDAGVSAAPSGAQRKTATTRGKRAEAPKVCADPLAPCPSSMPFEPHDLKFRLPKNAVIFETEEFYAIVLKTLRVKDTDCEKFVAESERLAAQKLFPKLKVFTSRCVDTLGVYYSTVAPEERVMALYAGRTREEADRVLKDVRATGKFPAAKLRRMHAGFNGT
jgi:hypothetical protein